MVRADGGVGGTNAKEKEKKRLGRTKKFSDESREIASLGNREEKKKKCWGEKTKELKRPGLVSNEDAFSEEAV